MRRIGLAQVRQHRSRQAQSVARRPDRREGNARKMKFPRKKFYLSIKNAMVPRIARNARFMIEKRMKYGPLLSW